MRLIWGAPKRGVCVRKPTKRRRKEGPGWRRKYVDKGAGGLGGTLGAGQGAGREKRRKLPVKKLKTPLKLEEFTSLKKKIQDWKKRQKQGCLKESKKTKSGGGSECIELLRD